MLEFGTDSPYQRFDQLRTRLVRRPADVRSVSTLGRALSQVLDNDCDIDDVRHMIADLEADRSRAARGSVDNRWELPLTSLLGLLKQNQAFREILAETLHPSAEPLRDKVLTAIDLGVDTPGRIKVRVNSPATTVLQTLRELADEGLIEPAESAEGQQERPYRRVKSDDDEAPGEWDYHPFQARTDVQDSKDETAKGQNAEGEEGATAGATEGEEIAPAAESNEGQSTRGRVQVQSAWASEDDEEDKKTDEGPGVSAT